MKYDLLLKNATIVTHNNTFRGNIAVSDGKIKEICDITVVPEAQEIVDIAGKYLLPGVIDAHVHIAWPDWDWGESCISTTRAAAAGGTTTTLIFTGAVSSGGAASVVADESEKVSMADFINDKRQIFSENAYVDGAFHGTVFSYDQVKEMIPLATSGGVTSFKLFMAHRASEVPGPWDGTDDGTLYAAFEEMAKLGPPAKVMTHCENIELLHRLKDKLPPEDELYWCTARPNFTEVESIKRAVLYAKQTGAALYIVHLSTKEAKDELRKAKADGVEIYGETCPHYLGLNYQNVDRLLSKVNPPIRTAEDSEALWQGIREGMITCIGSDHAECATKHKNSGFWSGIVGLPGTQTLLPVILSEGVSKGRISLQQAVAITSYNVAQTFGIYPQKGTIEIGSDADFVVVDMNLEKEVRNEDMHYICDFTPYNGKVYKGWPVMTFLRGKLIAKDNQIVGEKGYGKFIERKASLK